MNFPDLLFGDGHEEGRKEINGAKWTIDRGKGAHILGEKEGFLTFEEMNSVLPEDVTSSEQIDDIITLFGEMDIQIINGPEKAKAVKSIEASEEEEMVGPELDLTPSLVGPYR